LSVFGQRYVIDTNALGHLKRNRRASDFFREHAVIPSQVLHEAEGFPDLRELRKNEYPTTREVLEQLATVMASVPVGDMELVDLYANGGGADPFVVACALDGRAKESSYLYKPEWVVVTTDGAVRRKAKEFGLAVLSGDQFATIIDSIQDEPPASSPA
jgi:hypothetical protein